MKIQSIYVERSGWDGGEGGRTGITILLDDGDSYAEAVRWAESLLWPTQQPAPAPGARRPAATGILDDAIPF